VIGVLVVDDHPLFRAGVQSLLDSVPDMEVVATAADGEAALREATLHPPDVVLMDLTMRGMDGLEATRRIVRAVPSCAVLVLSMLDDDGSVLAAMRAGARGYVPKGAGQEELLAAIRAVATGGAVFGAGVAGRILAGLDRSPAPAFPGLTERESQVLTLMADGLDNRAIAEQLQMSTKTVANHVSHVLTKLQARDRVDAVLRARATER
jgi:DNA-binding NarL/FixJ family response regulator